MRRETTEKENVATKYPKYQILRWIDTSEEAMSRPLATKLYGVRIKPDKGSRWMHCCRGNEPLIYQTPEEASAAIAELRASDAVAA